MYVKHSPYLAMFCDELLPGVAFISFPLCRFDVLTVRELRRLGFIEMLISVRRVLYAR